MIYKFKKCYKEKLADVVRKYNNVFCEILTGKLPIHKSSDDIGLNRNGYHDMYYYTNIYIGSVLIDYVHIKINNTNKKAYLKMIRTDKISQNCTMFGDFHYDVHFKAGKVDWDYFNYTGNIFYIKGYKELCKYIEKHIENSKLNFDEELKRKYE